MILRVFMSVAFVWWKYYIMGTAVPLFPMLLLVTPVAWNWPWGGVFTPQKSANTTVHCVLSLSFPTTKSSSTFTSIPLQIALANLPWLNSVNSLEWSPFSKHPPQCPMVTSLTSRTSLTGWSGTGYWQRGRQCLKATLSIRLVSWEWRTHLLKTDLPTSWPPRKGAGFLQSSAGVLTWCLRQSIVFNMKA